MVMINQTNTLRIIKKAGKAINKLKRIGVGKLSDEELYNILHGAIIKSYAEKENKKNK